MDAGGTPNLATTPYDRVVAISSRTAPRIDLNADVGESFGPWPMGADDELIPLVSSVNIACGAHAGDPATILRTVQLAARHGIAIGAHPGYPDLAGFGRRDLDLSPTDLRASLIAQVGAVQAAARVVGATVGHVKPHGALYNRSAADLAIATTVAEAMRDLDSTLVLVGLAGSVSIVAGRTAGLVVSSEGFADRRYEADGALRSRPQSIGRSPNRPLAPMRSTSRRSFLPRRSPWGFRTL